MNIPLNIKLRQFTEEELDLHWRTCKSWKFTYLYEIPRKEWKTKRFDDIVLRLYYPVYKQSTTEKWKKMATPSPSQGHWPRNHKELPKYNLTVLATIASKFRKAFGEINLQLHRLWISVESSKDYVQKNLKGTQLCVVLSDGIDSIYRGSNK